MLKCFVLRKKKVVAEEKVRNNWLTRKGGYLSARRIYINR